MTSNATSGAIQRNLRLRRPPRPPPSLSRRVAAGPAGTAARPAALLLVVALVAEAGDELIAGFGVLVLVIAARAAEAARVLARA